LNDQPHLFLVYSINICTGIPRKVVRSQCMRSPLLTLSPSYRYAADRWSKLYSFFWYIAIEVHYRSDTHNIHCLRTLHIQENNIKKEKEKLLRARETDRPRSRKQHKDRDRDRERLLPWTGTNILLMSIEAFRRTSKPHNTSVDSC
jgi:hypothetical protein